MPPFACGTLTQAQYKCKAQVAELVDAPASGAGILTGVEVRVFSWAPLINQSVKFYIILITSQDNSPQRGG